MLKNYLEPDSWKDVYRKGKLVEELQERNTELLAQNNQLKLENDQLRKQLNIAKGTTDPRVEFFLPKFKHKSWSNFIFRISTQH